ncbi:MAG: right-handed parallel beta-helix repeat-containing protein, partial [Candidatus Brocadiaceae bacterium]
GGGVERARGVFEIQGQAHVRVSGLKLIGGGQRGRSGFLLRRAHHVTIQGCHTLRTGSSGVKLIECRDVVVDGNEIERACLSGAEECITVKMDSDCVRVSNNHIHDCRKEGIDVKEGARNVRVSGNHIHHVERQGLYTDAWDRETFNVEFSGNVIHDCGFGIAACSETGGLLHDVRICNNVVYNCAGPGLVLADWGRGENHPVRSVAFINNTVHRCGSRWGGGMHFYTTEAENVLVRNNIFSLCGPPPVDMRKEPVSRRIDHNLFHGPDRAFGLAAVRGDPLFVDADGGDFRLRPGSPAIDAGSPEEAPGRDIGGRERPWGDGMDIGAWEYTGGTQAGKKQGERQ